MMSMRARTFFAYALAARRITAERDLMTLNMTRAAFAAKPEEYKKLVSALRDASRTPTERKRREKRKPRYSTARRWKRIADSSDKMRGSVTVVEDGSITAMLEARRALDRQKKAEEE